VIASSADQFLSQHGNLSIAVLGKGSWTIRFGDPDEPIADGFVEDAELRVRFVPGAFRDFIDGKLDVDAALLKRRLVVAGDPRLFEKLGVLVSRGGSPLAARTAFKRK
jgi:hypothetical protein